MDGVVKVDRKLLKEVEELIKESRKKNELLYVNKRQVVNLAILEFLKSKGFKKARKKR